MSQPTAEARWRAILWTRSGITQITSGASDSIPTGITDDGSEVSLISYGDTLVSGGGSVVPGDTNATVDVFLRGPLP